MRCGTFLVGVLLALLVSDPAGAQSEAAHQGPDQETLCAITRSRDCSVDAAVKRGLFQTGLRPHFPTGIHCRSIDEHWAISYTHKRSRESYHGGIDMPAPWGEAIIAAAAGTVVAKVTDPDRTQRGIEVIVQHSPDDTGLPLWIYTSYGHFRSEPKVDVGQRVAMGEALGETGNSGSRGKRQKRVNRPRRPALHFAAIFAESSQYTTVRSTHVVPVDGRWADPVALYRGLTPIDSHSMKGLPASQKKVDIAVLLDSGEIMPPEAKIVWPYKCSRSALAPAPERYCNGRRCTDRRQQSTKQSAKTRRGGRGRCKRAADVRACRESRRRGPRR